MKKITINLFLMLLMFGTFNSFAQTLNQNASWPNVAWSVTGTFNTDPLAFEADPTLTSNFAFDDDDAGGTSDDDIAAESPVIDLTAAFTNGETLLTVTCDFTYNDLNDTLTLEYWDADGAAWVAWEQFVGTSVQPTNDFCLGARDAFTSVELDISGFTGSQQSGFRYRISFLDDGGAGGAAWEWGFCFDSPTISSAAPPACTPATATTMVVDDCGVSGGFNVTVDITDLGSATSLTLSDDQGSSDQTITATGMYSFGPYASGTTVEVTLVDDADPACTETWSGLTFNCPPANDLFANAIAVSCGGNVTGTTINATQDEATAPDTATVEADTSADNDSPWVWYSFTGSGAAERITLSTCNPGSDFDTEIFVYTGTSGALTCIDDGYDECGSPDFFAETSFDSDGTTTYYIAIGGWNVGNVGNFELSVSCATLSIDDVADEAAFTYYPNPVKNTLTLNAQNNIDNVIMYNMLGQEVLRANPNNVDSDIDMSGLQTGTYFVKVTIANITKTIRVIKQ